MHFFCERGPGKDEVCDVQVDEEPIGGAQDQTHKVRFEERPQASLN